MNFKLFVAAGSNKFRYEVGKSYQYLYETSTSTSLQGVSESVATIDVRATASIFVLSKCEMSLSVSRQGGQCVIFVPSFICDTFSVQTDASNNY